ncbi:MAG: PAS domain-containing sensor histidine kinase [Flavobacterium sp.]|uniref:sensor histidine kinase n=1 Tax=Flavobacterium sp. TaxID=239 RepID=UPI0011FEB303|nr:PAS domain-containing sensor histidine kinase [Flavobacterium sp.]RZJ65141.1 MAG: PAS domain-containing sensor histidine kinase [Flavobacterium sp.]
MAPNKNFDAEKPDGQIQNHPDFARAIAEASPDILFVMNLNTKDIIYTNRAIENILGYSKEKIEAMDKPFFDVMHPDDVAMFAEHLENMKSAADGEIIVVEYRMFDTNGSIHWFTDRNAIFKRDENGIPILKIGISHDSTAEKFAEDKIHTLNKSLIDKNRELESANSELKTFSNIAANDYQETLRTLYTNLEYVISTEARTLTDGSKGNLRKAQTAIQKMKLLTDDIVAFSRITELESDTSQVNLNEILLSVLRDLGEKLSRENVTVESQQLPVIKGFPMLLSLLFYHLLDNSSKFRHSDKKLVIGITHQVIPGSEMGILTDDGDYHQITFSDNGIGFDPKEADRIFTIFHRLHEKNKFRGSGIGLAVCKKIMDLHGGYISAVGIPDDGAVFSCYFPVDAN